jgi:alpha-ribazole phosphatase
MAITLIRHTPVDVPKGTCYGISDVLPVADISEYITRLKAQLNTDNKIIYSSPLKRCTILAQAVVGNNFITDKRLVELNFGDWEGDTWNNIFNNRKESAAWFNDFVRITVPRGESYMRQYQRVVNFIHNVITPEKDYIIFAHAGTIRAFLAYYRYIPLKDVFTVDVDYATPIVVG